MSIELSLPLNLLGTLFKQGQEPGKPIPINTDIIYNSIFTRIRILDCEIIFYEACHTFTVISLIISHHTLSDALVVAFFNYLGKNSQM